MVLCFETVVMLQQSLRQLLLSYVREALFIPLHPSSLGLPNKVDQLLTASLTFPRISFKPQFLFSESARSLAQGLFTC